MGKNNSPIRMLKGLTMMSIGNLITRKVSKIVLSNKMQQPIQHLKNMHNMAMFATRSVEAGVARPPYEVRRQVEFNSGYDEAPARCVSCWRLCLVQIQ